MSETSIYFQPVCGKNLIQARTTAKGGGKTWREMHSSLGKGDQSRPVEALLQLGMNVAGLLLTRPKMVGKADPVFAFVNIEWAISINSAALVCSLSTSRGFSEMLFTSFRLYRFSILSYVLSSFRDLLNAVKRMG